MAFAAELQARERKLAREQKERQEKARNKLESMRKAQEAAQARRAAEEEVQRAKRLAEAAQEEEKRLQWEADVAANRGVVYSERLAVENLPAEVAEAKGIRRSKDKVRLKTCRKACLADGDFAASKREMIEKGADFVPCHMLQVLLPPSAKFELLRHGVDRLGSLLFEITAEDGSRTHAGLLDFTASHGKVCLPQDVMRCLAGKTDTEYRGMVQVRYARLQGGEYAKLQPMEKAFQQVDDIKAGLESALLTRCTLTEGDVVSVSDGETLHELRVLELKPTSAVSIVETDLEVDIAPSLETEEEVQRLEEARKARKEQIKREIEEEELRTAQEKTAEDILKKEEALKQKEREERWGRLSQMLPPEPNPGPNVTTVLIRASDGTRRERRFSRSDRISQLFQFVDAGPCGGAEPGTYNLVMLYPRRIFTLSSDGDTTLNEAGITGRQESLLIEISKDHQ